jgi:hypothetical protein
MIGPGDLALNAGHQQSRSRHDRALSNGQNSEYGRGQERRHIPLLGEDDMKQALQLDWDFVASCLDRLALTQRAHQLRAAGESH